MSDFIFNHDFDVEWQFIDANGRLTLKAFEDFLQEEATQHAEELGFGFYYMAKYKALWVLLGVKATFYGHPKWRERVQLHSWHKGYKGASSFRDYQLFDQSGKLIAEAASEWVLINHETRRIVRPNILDPFMNSIVQTDVLPDFSLSEPQSGEENEVEYKVAFSDLDFNGHANNSRYFEWISNVFESVNHKHQSVERFEIRYLSECSWGEELLLHYCLSGDTFSVCGIKRESGKKAFKSILGLSAQ